MLSITLNRQFKWIHTLLNKYEICWLLVYIIYSNKYENLKLFIHNIQFALNKVENNSISNLFYKNNFNKLDFHFNKIYMDQMGHNIIEEEQQGSTINIEKVSEALKADNCECKEEIVE